MRMLRGFIVLALALLAAAQGAAARDRDAALSSAPMTDVRSGQTSGQIYVPVAKSQLLHVDQSFREINVGDKDIADVLPLSRNLIYVLGKKYGTTNLTIRRAGGQIIAVVDVVVTYDIDGLKQRLHELMPDENINVVPAGDAISLDGTVSSADHLHQILTIADHYAPGKVANLLSLSGTQQILLQVKFAEVSRNAEQELGINTKLQYTAGGDAITSATGVGTAANAFGTILGTFSHGNYNLTAELDALEQKGLVRTLAQPNLVALSGDTASFLAGGEFPIPVAQSLTTGVVPTVTVEFKEFGVSLAFTPTIIGKNLVNLVIKSEVSSLDKTLSVTANGIQVPALKVRRAHTTVEMNDGESFAVAGLLQDDFTNTTNQLPLLGNVPVLGALFRSANFQHQQTDLVMIVTVHLVAPTVAKNLTTPADSVVLPTPLQHYGTGDVEEPASKPETKDNQGYVLP
ncbi:MAG: type II and III secretion system protein family protein [Alphaproteobacteria bacterium]|nr:type II and III secretion system protein family protein [Alphaproteobacteria bacterium]